jgi:diamine N-acetyltransferase
MKGAGTPTLRPWRDSDLPRLQALRNDVPLQAQLLARARGSDESAVRRWLIERSNAGTSLFFVIADSETDDVLGYLQFADIDAIDRRGELGICLAPEAQGHGHGSASLRLALDQVRRSPGLRKVTLRVRSDNERAIRCYQRLGFAQCGLLREHVFIEDGWRDVVLMELFL